MDREVVWQDFLNSIFAKKYPQEINKIKDIFDLVSKPEDELTEEDSVTLNADVQLLEAWIYCRDNPSMAILHAVRLAYSEILDARFELGGEEGPNPNGVGKTVQDTFKTFGLLGGEIGDKTNRQAEHKKVMEVIDYMSPDLIKILELAGKIKFKGTRSKFKTKGPGRHKLKGITVSNAIEDMHVTELRMLDNELTEIITLKNYADGQLRVNEYEGEETLSAGPVILIEDISISMNGAPEQWAKALSIAVARSVASQKRPVYYIQFAGGCSPVTEIRTSSIKSICNTVLVNSEVVGGTCFEPPMKQALKVLKKDKRCDVIFITDGMGDSLSDNTLKELERMKDLQVIGVRIFDKETRSFYEEHSEEHLAEFCTSVFEVQELSVEKAVEIFNKIE